MTAPAPARQAGWAGLFWSAFKQSRNAMVLLDERRTVVEVNGACLELTGYRRGILVGRPMWDFVAGGPLMSEAEAEEMLARGEFTGSAELVCADTRLLSVQYAAHVEVVTGKRFVLFVAVQTSRAGRPRPRTEAPQGELSERELEVVRMIALGASGPEIAHELRISHNTVRTHVVHAMTKLGARSRAHLVAKSLGDGVALR